MGQVEEDGMCALAKVLSKVGRDCAVGQDEQEGGCFSAPGKRQTGPNLGPQGPPNYLSRPSRLGLTQADRIKQLP